MPYYLRAIDSCGLILSYRCQCACRHCLYAAGPTWSEWMEPDFLDELLRGIKRVWKRPRGLHLAGGEPFLNFELLLLGVSRCRELGLPIEYVETNGGWAVDEARARERLVLLREAGLERLLISLSPFHAETIPLQVTLRAIALAREVLGEENIIVYLPHLEPIMAQLGKERPVCLSKYLQRFGPRETGRILFEGYGLIPGGRAGLLLGALLEGRPLSRFAGQNCLREIIFSRHAHFDPYGNYIPLFCGGLSLGRFRDLYRFVKELDVQTLPLARILVEEGPYGLAQMAMVDYGFEPAPEGYVGKCHLCVDVRRHLVARGADFQELAPKAFYEHLFDRPPLRP